MSAPVLPRVVDALRRAGPAPSANDLSALVALLAAVPASELGIRAPRRTPLSPRATPIGYCHVGALGALADLSIFLIPPHVAMPVHDHPCMTVLSRVLFGSMDIVSYTAADVLPGRAPYPARMRAQRATETVGAGTVRTLTPTQGNIHSFRAKEWTAVFDIALPPYAPDDGRPCTYFDVQEEDGNDVLLTAVPCPDDYVTMDFGYEGQPLPSL